MMRGRSGPEDGSDENVTQYLPYQSAPSRHGEGEGLSERGFDPSL